MSTDDKQPKEVRYLRIPMGDKSEAWIPLEVADEDFQLLLDTLSLWKPNIVAKKPEPTPEP